MADTKFNWRTESMIYIMGLDELLLGNGFAFIDVGLFINSVIDVWSVWQWQYI